MTTRMRTIVSLIACFCLSFLAAGCASTPVPSDVTDLKPAEIFQDTSGVLHVEGRFLYNQYGEKVIIRGIEEFQNNSIDQIARTGANAYRLAYYANVEELEKLLSKAIAEHGMIVSLMIGQQPDEVHIWNEPDIKALLKNYESHITLLVQGEAQYRGAETAWRWLKEVKETIRKVREYGYLCPLEIMPNDWGQNLGILLSRGKEIIAADPLHNVILHCQFYSQTRPEGNNHMTVEQAINAIVKSGLPFQVGASAFTGPDCKPAYDCPPDNWIRTWKGAYENEIGCYYWCWSGSPSWFPACDGLSVDGSYGNWSKYGEEICGSGGYSTAQTSVKDSYPFSNRPPRQVKKFSGTLVGSEARDLKAYANVGEYFMDFEDGTALTYALELDNPYILSGEIDADGVLAMRTLEGSVGTCRVTVVATDSGGKIARGSFDVVAQDPTKGNAALHKTVTASSVEGTLAVDGAANAVDGNFYTRWWSKHSNDQWLMVDLGSALTVDRIRLEWEVAYGEVYEIQISTDNKRWQTVVAVKDGDGGVDDYPITPVTARYVKVRGILGGLPWGYGIFELQVHRRE
jgi:hypothetical protein